MTSSMLSVMHDWAVRDPERPFLFEENDLVLSYGAAYVLAVKMIAPRLQALIPTFQEGVENVVVILTPNSVLFPLHLLSLWSIRARVVPLSPTADPHLWAGMIRLVDPCLILASQTLIDSLNKALKMADLKNYIVTDISTPLPLEVPQPNPNRSPRYISSCLSWMSEAFDSTTTACVMTSMPSPSLDPTCKALTLFTSSAVDWETLKCVSYTHSTLHESSSRAMLMLGGETYSSQAQRHLGWLPLSHCFEFCISFCGIVLRTGGSYVIFDRSVSSPDLPQSTSLPKVLLRGLEYHEEITSITLLPAVLAEILPLCSQNDLKRLQQLHSIGVGGARTSESVFQWAASRGLPYFDCSGATEAAGTICIRRALDVEQRRNGLQVISGLMGVLEKSNADDDFGELIIRGTHLPVGYEFRQSEAFSYNALTGITTYRTGDLYSHKIGQGATYSYTRGQPMPEYTLTRQPLSGLTYLGRNDDMVILSSGVKIDALSLERQIDACAAVSRSAVIGSTGNHHILALIQPTDDTYPPAVVNALLSLNVSLPFEKRIHREHIIIVRELPLTTKMTLNRKKVKHLLSTIDNDSEIHSVFPPPLAFSADAHALPSKKEVFPQYRHRVAELISNVLNVPITTVTLPGATLLDVPFSSLSAVQLAKALQTEFSVSLSAAQLYSIRTIDDLCQLLDNTQETVRCTSRCETPGQSLPYSASTDKIEDLVITGAACRFVGGIDSLDAFWSALLTPDHFLRTLDRIRPASRWQEGDGEEKMYPSGWLDPSNTDNVSSFADFFGFSPKEAEAMSVNARLALQLGYQAIEDAGIAPHSLNGKEWGVFTSVNDSGWNLRRAADHNVDEYASSMYGSADDAVGARLSYFLNLTGPTMEVKTACSSSAVAIHQARLAIEHGDCEAALVIASTTHYHPAGAIFRSSSGIVSPRGKCEPFLQSADGFVASEGAAAIVLQKASDAATQAYASIRATAVVQDGASLGFFSPNANAQTRLLRRILQRGECSSKDIALVEAHGTGTQIGDAIELQALGDVFGRTAEKLVIGSCKAVIGHTEECAGLASVLKVMLCLQNNLIPPQPSSGHVMFNDEFGNLVPGATMLSKVASFPTQTRTCIVSSFGLSGTLAGVLLQPVLEPHVSTLPKDSSSKTHIFLITARNVHDFHASVCKHIEFFRGQQLHAKMLASVCVTTQVGRTHFAVRRAWAVRDWKELLQCLHSSLNQTPLPLLPALPPKVGIWFGTMGYLKDEAGQSPESHPLLSSFMAGHESDEWLPIYQGYMAKLALAECLVALGCDVTVAGGEGITEYLAGILSGLLPPHAAFKMYDDNAQEELVVVRGSEEKLKQHIIQWSPVDCSLVGRHGNGLYSLRCSSSLLPLLTTDPELEVQGRLPSATYLSPITINGDASMKVVSGHLCEVLDKDLRASFNYWSAVQSRSVNAPEALKVVESLCDVVVVLDDCQVEDHGKYVGGDFHHIIAGLFERGCSLDWSRLRVKEQTLLAERLPSYTWAVSNETTVNH